MLVAAAILGDAVSFKLAEEGVVSQTRVGRGPGTLGVSLSVRGARGVEVSPVWTCAECARGEWVRRGGGSPRSRKRRIVRVARPEGRVAVVVAGGCVVVGGERRRRSFSGRELVVVRVEGVKGGRRSLLSVMGPTVAEGREENGEEIWRCRSAAARRCRRVSLDVMDQDA